MKCENCIHNGVCKYNDFKSPFYNCPCFQDKDKVIELPCKVGDTVYKVWYQPCHLGVSYPDSIDCDGCYDECDIKKSLFEIEVPNIDFIFRQFISDKNNSVYFI